MEPKYIVLIGLLVVAGFVAYKYLRRANTAKIEVPKPQNGLNDRRSDAP